MLADARVQSLSALYAAGQRGASEGVLPPQRERIMRNVPHRYPGMLEMLLPGAPGGAARAPPELAVTHPDEPATPPIVVGARVKADNGAPASPPSVIVFATTPVPFAVRDPLPGVELDTAERPGLGVALWPHGTDAQALHDQLTTAGVPIVTAPFDGLFGRTFTFTDPDGYAVTIHDKQ